MSAQFQAWVDQEDARLTSVIREYGWSIEYIGGGICSYPGCDGNDEHEQPFAYTVGLFGLGHPELLVLGLSMGASLKLLDALGDMIREGENILPGIVLMIEGWRRRVIPEVVPNPGEIVFIANRFYQRPDDFSVPVLQLTYEDEAGLFPWDEGFSDPGSQPRPGTFRA
jgi:hypothetical protein